MSDRDTSYDEWRAYERYLDALAVDAYYERKALELAEKPKALELDPRCLVCGRPSAAAECPTCDRDYLPRDVEDGPW